MEADFIGFLYYIDEMEKLSVEFISIQLMIVLIGVLFGSAVSGR